MNKDFKQYEKWESENSAVSNQNALSDLFGDIILFMLGIMLIELLIIAFIL